MMTIISDDDSGGDDDDDCNKKRQSLTCPPELTAAAGSDSSAPNPMCFEHSSSVTCYCEHHVFPRAIMRHGILRAITYVLSTVQL